MKRFRYSAIASLILIALLLAVSATAQTVDELLKRHLEALGGEKAVRSIISASSTAEIELLGTGLKGIIRSQSARPCLSYSEITLGFFKIREGYDGERSWMVDPNGKLQIKRDPASLEYQKTMCLLESQDYLFGGDDFELTSGGRDTIDGTPCEVLDLAVTGGTPCRIYLSDSTSLIRRLEIKAPEGRAIQTYGDYRPVNGVMLPFVTRTELPAMGQRIEMRYETITPNPPIDPVVFLPPAADVKDYHFATGSSAEGIPFEYKYRHLFMPVRIGDDPDRMLFLLDSGASMTVVDSTVAARLHLPFGGTVPGAGAGGTADFYMIKLPGLGIDGIEFSEQTAIAYPIANLLKSFEETEIAGVLGYDFLSRFTTTIDYEHRLLSFFEPDSFAASRGETAIEAPLLHNIFSLPVTIDGTRRGTFLLDTGANSSVIQGRFAKENGIAEGRHTIEIAVRGAGGTEHASLCRLDSLSIGPMTVRGPVLAIATGTKGLGALEAVDGIIGNDILERFSVTLDYKKQRVFLERNARTGEPFYRDRAGLQLMRRDDGAIVVAAVLAGSPGEAAGLKAEDVLLAVGGRKASTFASIEELTKLFEAKDGTKYKMEISRGGRKRSVNLTLRQYL